MTLPVARKGLFRLTFIAVNFPAAAAFAVPSGILNKTDDVSERITQKYTDFVGKFTAGHHTLPEKADRVLAGESLISISRKKSAFAAVGQKLLERGIAADIDQRPAVVKF